MENVLTELLAALKERLAIIADENSRQSPETHMARLQKVSEKIDRLHALLPKPIDPRLHHYLERRSYDKALEALENR